MQQAEPNILERIGRDVPEVDEFCDGEDYRAFGISRKQFGGEPLIDFIARDGNHQALPNSDIRRITFNPSESLVLEFSEHVVALRGRGLSTLYQKLLMQRVVFICEADEASRKLAGETESVIVEMIIGPQSMLEPSPLIE